MMESAISAKRWPDRSRTRCGSTKKMIRTGSSIRKRILRDGSFYVQSLKFPYNLFLYLSRNGFQRRPDGPAREAVQSMEQDFQRWRKRRIPVEDVALPFDPLLSVR